MLCSWIGRFNIVSMAVLLNLTYRFYAIPVKIPGSYFMDINKWIIQRGKSLRIASSVLKKKHKVGVLILSDLKTYYKATVIKIGWYLLKNRSIKHNRKPRNRPI